MYDAARIGAGEPDPIATFAPSDVRYIKLGAGGGWEKTAIEGGTLEWGSANDPHALIGSGDWAAVHACYVAQGRNKGTASGYVREARDIYFGDAATLWITFASGHLWWGFAEPGVAHRSGADTKHEGTAYRRMIGGWRNTDLAGRPLAMVDISTSLTKVAAYQQTICSVDAKDYLLRLIRGEPDPATIIARQAEEDFARALLPLIQRLHQSDFELFADLLFGAMGWRRRSVLGGTMKDIDLLIERPSTGERACVQVKSAADQRVLERCTEAIRTGWPGDSFYFVCHSPRGPLQPPQATAAGHKVHVLAGADLARLAIHNGLAGWLLVRAG